MTDTDRLAALIDAAIRDIEHSGNAATVPAIAARLAAAGVAVNQPAPDALRAAAQAVVEAAKPLNTPLEWAADNRARLVIDANHFDALMDAVDALFRAALAEPTGTGEVAP